MSSPKSDLKRILSDLIVGLAVSVHNDDVLGGNKAEAEALSEILKLIEKAEHKARVEELQKHSDQWRVWQDDVKTVELDDVINWYDLRLSELREEVSE